MAKIVLLSRNSKHTTWPLVLSLKSQQHQVHLITDRNIDISDSAGIEIMSYFKSWSLLEAVRLMPTFLSINPQIFHLILEKDELSAAEIFLSYMAQSLPHCVVTTSLLDLENGVRKNRWLKSIIKKSDIVTFPSVETLGHLRGLNIQNKRQNRGLLPPLLSQEPVGLEKSQVFSELRNWIHEKQTLALPMIFNPKENSEELFQLLEKLGKTYHLLFLGSWNNWSVRARKKFSARMQRMNINWTISETLQSNDSQKLLESCQALWLAGLTMSPTEYTQNLWNSWKAQVPLVIDMTQAAMHSGLWKDQVNVHILRNDVFSTELDRILAKKTLKTPEMLTIQTTRDLTDHSTNDLNRLYNKALSEKALT